jgi:DNA-binding CsgD family transcriptional regulator
VTEHNSAATQGRRASESLFTRERLLRFPGFPAEKRATVRVFIIDDELNIVDSSAHAGDEGPVRIASMPAGLRPTLLRLMAQCKADPMASHAVAFSESRVIRLVAMSGSPKTYVVTVERYTPYAKLLSSLERFGLSSRELDVLLLALAGKTAAETAQQLNIAVSTATDYLNRLQLKTGARNKSDLIAKVLGWQSERVTGTTAANRRRTRYRTPDA